VRYAVFTRGIHGAAARGIAHRMHGHTRCR
jgi:hypothetical protein